MSDAATGKFRGKHPAADIHFRERRPQIAGKALNIMNEITNRADRRTQTRKGKRRPVIAIVLATLAIGGIGAAATSAAWTDNVFFSATAQAATFNLQGSLDGSTNWVESDNQSSIQLTIPASTFGNMLPGQTRTATVYVKNTGTTNASLTVSAAYASGATFTTNPTVTAVATSSTLTAASGATPQTAITVTVTAPSDWATTNQGKTGTIVVTVAGTATA
jgi:hypothetical protein